MNVSRLTLKRVEIGSTRHVAFRWGIVIGLLYLYAGLDTSSETDERSCRQKLLDPALGLNLLDGPNTQVALRS
jgi:hypothetical protein